MDPRTGKQGMTLETFFNMFDQFADAPNAVAKMRELVLQLAVQGRLVDQKQGDGDAAQLLTAISRERDARAAKLRTPEEPASADGDGHPFQIPSTWAWTQLGKIALQIQYGYTASADPSATEIRMLRITDIQNNRVDWPSVPGCQIEQGDAEKYLLSPNDILIARTGGTIGKSFIVPNAPVKSVFASYLIRVTPPRSMAARYLKTFLESPLYWTQLRTMSAGTGQPNVNGQALGRLELPLPPLAEQKRIVAKVDELMALCDRLEAQQQKREARHAALARASLARFADAPTPANLNFLFHKSYTIPPADLRKSILTLAVQGKLVHQDPNDEAGALLLERISAERLAAVKARRISPMKQLPPVADDELAFEVRPGWALAHLIELVMEIQTGPFGSSLHKSDYQLGETPVINPASLKDGKIVPIDEMAIGDATLKRLEVFKLSAGDIVMARRGEMGRCAIVTKNEQGWLCGTGSLVLRMPPSLYAPYLAMLIGAPEAREYLGGASVRTTMQNLNQSILARMPVGVPPVAEQRRIVARVNQLMLLVDQLETQLAASSAAAPCLLEAILHEVLSS
jgi:type I restriction enzyme S subunit